MKELAPSILSADFNRLGECIQVVEKMGIHYLHVDVMDGQFVPSISFGMPVISSIRKETKLLFDVHLMIQEPIRYLKKFTEAGADSITVHAEACENLEQTIQAMKQYPVKVAVSLNPETPVSVIEPFLSQLDMVLVMGVHPGFGGQKLIPETLHKITQLNQIRREKGLDYLIEIDGGINKENIEEIARMGTDIIVAGTAVFKGDIAQNTKELKGVIEGAS